MDSDGVEQFDHPGPVVTHGGMDRATISQGHEFLACSFGFRSIDKGASVDSCQRPDTIPAVLGPRASARNGKLHVGPGTDLLADDSR